MKPLRFSLGEMRDVLEVRSLLAEGVQDEPGRDMTAGSASAGTMRTIWNRLSADGLMRRPVA
jgi:hypothetical protein